MVFGLKIFGMMYGMGCFGVDIDLCALQNRVGCNRGVMFGLLVTYAPMTSLSLCEVVSLL